MFNYLLLHGLLTVGFFALLAVLKTAPPRLKFFLTVSAMLTWLLPLPLFRLNLPTENSLVAAPYRVLVLAGGLMEEPLAKTAENNPTGVDPTRAALLLWFLIGAMLSVRSLRTHRREMRRLAGIAKPCPWLEASLPIPAGIQLRLIPGSGAMTGGLRNPTIWIGETHGEGEEVKALVIHELAHIRQHDHRWTPAIHLFEKFFWWNPLIRILADKARLYQELSCDQTCLLSLDPAFYRKALAKTFLISSGIAPVNQRMAAAFLSEKHHNMRRLKMIGTQYRFTWRHLAPLLFFLTLGTALAAFSPVAHPKGSPQPKASPSPSTSALNEDEEVFKLGTANVMPPSFTKKVSPTYPQQAIAAGIEGFVILEAVLRKSGQIDSVIVLRGIEEGRYGFEQAAIDALQQWEYQPGTAKGAPADVRMALKINFVLDGHYRILANLEWKVDGDVEEHTPPKALLEKAFEDKLNKGSLAYLPAWVSLDETGKLLEAPLDDEAREKINDEELVQQNLSESLKNIIWVTAKRGDQGVPSEFKINIPISLNEDLQD